VILYTRDTRDLEQQLELFITGRSSDRIFLGLADKQKTRFPGGQDPIQDPIQKPIKNRQMAQLAERWVNGQDINWDVFYPAGSVRRLAGLPTYPFAKQAYWVPGVESHFGTQPAPMVEKPALAAPSRDSARILTFAETWDEMPLEQVVPDPDPKLLICFLTHPKNQETFLRTARKIHPDTQVIFISQGSAYERQSPRHYVVSPFDATDYEKAFDSIRLAHETIDTLVYLWAHEVSALIRNYAPIVCLIQAMSPARPFGLKPADLVLAAGYNTGLERCFLESWIGFERSLPMLVPGTRARVILWQNPGENQASPGQNPFDVLGSLLLDELMQPQGQSVVYQDQKRLTPRVKPSIVPKGKAMIKPGGTYLITGGLGGLGLIFARHFARQNSGDSPMTLLLTGRSELTREKKQKIQSVERLFNNPHSSVLYVRADVTDKGAMETVFREHFHLAGIHGTDFKQIGINGVIHAAGIHDPTGLGEKTMAKVEAVLAPKITGTLVLDALLEKEPLDFICYFSSASAVLGDFGSCDYAVANRFQTAFADFQQETRELTRVCAIHWPLWQEGGMGFDTKDQARMYLESSGLEFLEPHEGCRLFDDLIGSPAPGHLVLKGQADAIYRFLNIPSPKPRTVEQSLEADIKSIAGNLLSIPREHLSNDDHFAEFGFDSILLAEFARLLSAFYQIDISPSLFFGYPDFAHLTRYFLTRHKAMLKNFYGTTNESHGTAEKPNSQKPGHQSACRVQADSGQTEPIAIIGMSGRFPDSRNIDELWQILSQGTNAVGHIPPSGTGVNSMGRVPGVAEFDPLFFKLSPWEGLRMDPRQRLLLQEAWNALEDAGYGAAHLEKSTIGIFVGAEKGDFQNLAEKDDLVTANHDAMLSARIAYFLNLTGPNMVINTACSSGLVAAHQACNSLYNNECDTAIAAGVNLILTRQTLAELAQTQMLSKSGRSLVFDQRADGMVPGEAVAVVVLKRLSKALADKDPIYATIRASQVNYDGKTNGITSPSGTSQTRLFTSAYEKGRVNPEAIEYVVAHGTGTRLGDPVEVNALNAAFKHFTDKQNFCALTSTKTNFGHTFAASGLVSLVSLVQALVHEQIPASLHCEQKNEYIAWTASPFYVNQTLKPWPACPGKPRMGAVSAFGMSGTNAHMVVESHLPEPLPRNSVLGFVLVFSAKTFEALDQKLLDMVSWLTKNPLPGNNLAAVSHTLLEGRHHFHLRCALVVRDRQDALDLLNQAIAKKESPWIFTGSVLLKDGAKDPVAARTLIQDNLAPNTPKEVYLTGLCKLAGLYCQG
ncbi:MAG: KR domain-containing protein, partial [Spirochaetes bacterium]|nr:KR domain-containing protein [Spirochaetota bacterium]